MQQEFGAKSSCESCAYWQHMGDQLGLCRLKAPPPCDERDEVGHWPTTRRDAVCGEWRTTGWGAPNPVTCKTCRYWRHHSDGIDPVDRRDQLPAWWAAAGHCVRLAPAPSGRPGHRACWRATHAQDCCFMGAPLAE